MAFELVWTLGAVGAVSLLSLVGALTLTTGILRRHVVVIALVALAAGALMGDAFFHLLPEAIEAGGEGLPPSMALVVLVGFVLFFLLEVALRWGHAHGEAEHHHEPHAAERHVAAFGWLNLVGDGVHNLIDGVLIATAFIVDVPLGIATTIAVAVHEIPQELGDFAVLLRAGLKPGRALAYNFGSALLSVLGALLVFGLALEADVLERYALPLIAGGFLYIAAADLVPELHHHTDRKHAPVILLGLVVGLALMWLLVGVEV